MGKKTERRNKRKQRSYAAKQHEPRACRPHVDAEVLMLQQALQTAEKTNRKMASFNTHLRKQLQEFARMEKSWGVEKQKLVRKNSIIQRILRRKYTHARNEINRLEEVLTAAETNKDFRKEENERPQVAFENTLEEGERRRPREEQIATELKEMHDKCQKQEVVIMKKEKLITWFQREIIALAKEYIQKEDTERQLKVKWEALEVRIKEEWRRERRTFTRKSSLSVCPSPVLYSSSVISTAAS